MTYTSCSQVTDDQVDYQEPNPVLNNDTDNHTTTSFLGVAQMEHFLPKSKQISLNIITV